MYRRVVDWDVEPTPFQRVRHRRDQRSDPRALVFTSDDGFTTPNPLTSWTSLGYGTGLFSDVGPWDLGAFLEFRFPRMGPGEAKTFYLYYGAAPDEASALAALAAVGAQVYSLGQPSLPGGPDQGIPNTFMFGFGDAAEPPGGPLGSEGMGPGAASQSDWFFEWQVSPGVNRQDETAQ